MTNILASGVAGEAHFASHMMDTERQVRSFLVTSARYLASCRDAVVLGRLEAAAEDTWSMSADEFDRMLVKDWRNSGK